MQTSIDDIIHEIYEENKRYFRSKKEVKTIVYRFLTEIAIVINNYEKLKFNESFGLTFTDAGKLNKKNYKALKRYNMLKLYKKHNDSANQIVNDFLT